LKRFSVQLFHVFPSLYASPVGPVIAITRDMTATEGGAAMTIARIQLVDARFLS
jgi:hypothetical protein